MKKYIYTLLAVIVLVGGSILWQTNKVPTDTGKKIITVGFMLPLSGDFGGIGAGVGNAARMAVSDYEATHPNVKVAIVQEDDKFDVKTGLGIYTKMTTIDNVNAIFMVSTPILDALHEKMQDAKIPVVSVGLQNTGIADDNIFQTSPNPNAPIRDLAKFIDSRSHKKVAILYGNNAPALLGFYDAFKNTYTKDTVEFIINNDDDAKTVATKVKASGADAVVIMSMPSVGATMTKELKKLNVPVDYYYDAQLSTGWSEYKKILGDTKVIDGAYVLHFTSGDQTAFSKRYKELYGIDPAPFAEYGYDSVKAMLESYDQDNGKWVAGIEKVNFQGPSGEMKFDKDGVRIQGTEIWRVRGGEIVKE